MENQPSISCNPRSTAAFPRIIPVDPPIVNINKNNNEKKTELILRCNNGGFPKVVDYKIYEFPIFLSLQNKLLKEKLQHQKRRLRRRRPIVR